MAQFPHEQSNAMSITFNQIIHYAHSWNKAQQEEQQSERNDRVKIHFKYVISLIRKNNSKGLYKLICRLFIEDA